MLSFEDVLLSIQECVISEDGPRDQTQHTLALFTDKLSQSSRVGVKRSKERCLEEAAQLIRQISEAELAALQQNQLVLLVRLLISTQLLSVSSSTACRKVDQMLQHLAKVHHALVYRETHHCLNSMVNSDQILSFEDLQRACMFLEDSSVGREVWRELHPSLLGKVSQLFPAVLGRESLRDGALGYTAVKLCLQIFQLLSSEMAPLVWDQTHCSSAVQGILQALMDLILGQCSNRDTRLLAGSAVAMLINTAPENRHGGTAAWNLLQASDSEPWVLRVGALQIRCSPTGRDGAVRLAVIRCLLTCCPPHILLSSPTDASEECLLLSGLFPLVHALCEEKLDCHYFAFEVLTLWLRRVKENLAEIWRMTGVRLLPDDSRMLQQLVHIIWTNAESPVEGVSEFVRSAFSLLLDIYEKDSQQFADTEKLLYPTLLQKIIDLPWEAKARYHRLCALLPYLGTDMVMDQYAEMPCHLLKCLSTNHLSPCASELYKFVLQRQRQELCAGTDSHTEEELADRWAERWRPVLHEALTSNVTLLQGNSSTHLLPGTFQVFPSAVDHLLASLDPSAPGHLHAWACVMSSYRAVTGASPWALQGGSTLQTLSLALGSADDKVRLAALNLLCCSPKTRDTPTAEEVALMRTFIPQNLNCESSPFRQHFQAGVKRFLVRIRDGCLASVKGQKGKKSKDSDLSEDTLQLGIGFVEWLNELPYSHLAPGHSYQRKKTVLLLLSALLETCTDTWSPDKKKGQPPANMGCLIGLAQQRGQWDFFSRTKQLVLVSCLQDSTNEIRELSAGLLLRFFPPGFPDDVAAVLLTRSKQLLRSPRVQEAQMGALMAKLLLLKSPQRPEDVRLNGDVTGPNGGDRCMLRFLLKELEEQYLFAKTDMMLAARTRPIHGVVSALHRCLLEAGSLISDTLDHNLTAQLLHLLENISLLLLGVLYGDQDACATDNEAPPSFCDMGNAISSLIAQTPGGGGHEDGEECVLLSEEHSLILTCCWVSLKEVGIFLGSLVERILSESNPGKCLLDREDLIRASMIFKNILLKCRQWGAVEGCCIGFTKFCSSLLCSSDPELSDIPANMLKQGLQVVQCPRPTSVTRRAAGLPMLILCVLSAEEAGKARPLLALSVQTLLQTAQTPLPEKWDQTLDRPQVCAVHTLQALVRGSGLGAAVLQFAPAVAILSLTLLSSACWAMRNAALQLYSSLCSRMLGQRPSSDSSGPTQLAMSPAAFFFHYPALQPFLLSELQGAAHHLQAGPNEAKLHLQPSLHPVLTLLAQLQPGVQDTTGTLSYFLPPLLQLAASPIYSVRVMASKALVAMTPPSEYMHILIQLTDQLPGPQDRCCHNQLHGELLQIKAVLERARPCADSAPSSALSEVLRKLEKSLWLVTAAQRCPLVRGVYLGVAESLRGVCSQTYLSLLSDTLMHSLQTPPSGLQVGLSSFHQRAVHFLCADLKWACQIWSSFPGASADLKLCLVKWAVEEQRPQLPELKEVMQRVLLSNLREALLSQSVDYRGTYLTALVTVMAAGAETSSPPHSDSDLCESVDLLLQDLDQQRGGPEFLSQALCAVSLLLPDSRAKTSALQRWCAILERHRSPDAPEVLRMACADALCQAGVPLMCPREHGAPPAVMVRLINTALHLLQDQDQQVRAQAARFTSMLQHTRGGGGGGGEREGRPSVHVMQVNQALPLLLQLLLDQHCHAPGALEALLCHLPQSDLTPVLSQASETGCFSLYEQDEANVFAEPSVMSAHVLPFLLRLADNGSECLALTQSLSLWAEQSAPQVSEGLRVCRELQPAESLTPAWLSLLTDPRFHGNLSSLFTKTAFLLRLGGTSECARGLCDTSTLRSASQEVLSWLGHNGVHFPPALTAALAGGQ